MKLPSQIAVFAVCFLVVSGASCPEAEDMYPCECKEKTSGGGVVITCSGKYISLQHVERALKRMDGKETVDLQLMYLQKLGKLKGDQFAAFRIRSLLIYHCDIDALTDGNKPSFSGLEDKLEQLFIVSSLKGSPSLKLSHLGKVTTLNVFDNQLREVKEIRFPASLKSLMFSNNGIKNLPDGAFANLVHTGAMALDRNDIETFKRNWLPGPGNELDHINLNANHLTSLPRDAFSNMPSLDSVFLQENRIRSMEQETWIGIWPQLSHIHMEGNPLVCDSKLRWIQQVEGGAEIHGKCREPANVAGIEIEDWLRQASPEFDQMQE